MTVLTVGVVLRLQSTHTTQVPHPGGHLLLCVCRQEVGPLLGLMKGFDREQEGVEFKVKGFDDLFAMLQIYDPLQSFTVLIPVVVQYVLVRKTTLGLEQDKEPSLPSLSKRNQKLNMSPLLLYPQKK